MAKSKFFRVFTEGDTTDGRVIQRGWIEQIVKNFNPAKFGARVWLEHIRGILPDSPFKAYGDVTAVKAEEVEIDGKKKLALYAQLDATEDLVAMNKKRQKVYTSVEIDPNFARSGEAYLVGLAVTDSPASLGTEMLAFAANAKVNPLAERKQGPDNLFTAAQEVAIEFEDEAPPPQAGDSLFTRVMDLLKGKSKDDAGRFTDIGQAVEAVADSQRGLLGQFAALTTAAEADRKAFADFKSAMDKAPVGEKRPPAAGGTGAKVTDC